MMNIKKASLVELMYLDKPTKKRLQKVLINMKQRCYNPNRKDYECYGQRGITV